MIKFGKKYDDRKRNKNSGLIISLLVPFQIKFSGSKIFNSGILFSCLKEKWHSPESQ